MKFEQSVLLFGLVRENGNRKLLALLIQYSSFKKQIRPHGLSQVLNSNLTSNLIIILKYLAVQKPTDKRFLKEFCHFFTPHKPASFPMLL